MKRLPEPWIYWSNPFDYSGEEAQVIFPPLPQRTRNVIVGGIAVGPTAGITWNNAITQFRVEGKDCLVGPGCFLSLIFGESRISGAQTGAVVASGFPTENGWPFWPGQALELYDGKRVGGIPYEGREKINMRLENLNGGNPAFEIEQLGLIMFELPNEPGDENAEEMTRRWRALYDGLDSLVFGTHAIVVGAAGLNNFEDALPLQPWHTKQLRSVDFKGGLVRNDGVLVNPQEDIYRQASFNRRSDRTRNWSTALVPAGTLSGFAGFSISGVVPLDYESDGSDRDIITVSAIPSVFGDIISFCTYLSGIEERQYFGRLGGNSF